MTIPARRRALLAALVVTASVPLVLAGCSVGGGGGTGASDDSPRTPAKSAAEPAGDPSKNLCDFLPKEEMTDVLAAYDSPIATEAPGTENGMPTCTITGTDPDYVTVVTLSDTSFEDTIAGQLGPADAPPENDSVWLPAARSFAAAHGDRTVLVRGADDATGATPTMIFVMGTVLDHLP